MGCGSVVDRTPFRPTDDLVTPSPRSLVETGHSSVVSPPQGVHFALTLAAVRETPRQGVPTQRYELQIAVTCQGDVPWKADVDQIELVDDVGTVLRPGGIARNPTEAADGTTTYMVTFALPPSYRVREVTRVTVHWALVNPQRRAVRISSRFRP